MLTAHQSTFKYNLSLEYEMSYGSEFYERRPNIMARKINVKLILELRDAGMSRSAIASTRKISRNSVSEVFNIADERHISFDDVRGMTDEEAYRFFYPEKYVNEIMYEQPDYEYVHNELKKVGVTLKLLHEEYVEKCHREDQIPVGRTKFNEGYTEYTAENHLTNHLEHKPGERCEVDWSGPTMHYVDRNTGEIIKVYLFVGTLPYSQYTYVEPCLNMKMNSFIGCHVNMYEYFGGVPTRTICDNLKTGVVSHPKNGEIILTDDYEALGSHYMTAIMPAQVRKPKQKSSVEGSVGKIATAIIAKCRNMTFYSLAELKIAVAEKLKDFNHEPFQKREGSRYEIWLEEKTYLRSLPSLPYEVSEWIYGRTIHVDFHVVYNKNRYSCPYQYAKKKDHKVDLRVTASTVEIYYKGDRIATHHRFPDYVQNRYSTHQEDMPKAFRDIVEWDDVRIRKWARSIGKYTSDVIDRIFNYVDIKEQGYNPSLAVLRLSRTYSDARLETACEVALSRGIRSPRYRHLKAILSSNQDIVFKEKQAAAMEPEDASMGFLRGSDYYKKGGHK